VWNQQNEMGRPISRLLKVARSRAPQRAVSRSGAPSLRSRACSGRNEARTHTERSGPWPTTHYRIPPPAAAALLAAIPFFYLPPLVPLAAAVLHLLFPRRPCPALLPRRLRTPPSSNRHLCRSSTAPDHPSKVPRTPASPLATPTLKADEHPAPPHPRAPNLSSSAQLPSCSRIAIVLSAAAPCRSQRRRQRRLPRQRRCQGRKYEQGEVMGCSPKRSSR
jgi:hypothetical protein